MTLPPILYWSPSLASHHDAGQMGGVIDATDAGLLWYAHDGGLNVLSELPADAVLLVVDGGTVETRTEWGVRWLAEPDSDDPEAPNPEWRDSEADARRLYERNSLDAELVRQLVRRGPWTAVTE